MKNNILVLLLLLTANLALAQQESSNNSSVKTSSSIYLAYSSSIVYPGLRTGLQMPFRATQVNKTLKSGKEKTILKDRFFTANLGWYHQPTFHSNTYLTAGFTSRRTSDKGFFVEFSPELGYSRTFLAGTTYKVDELGNVSIKKMAGHNYALFSLGGGLGYDFSIKHSKPYAIYYKLNLLTMFPYNNTIYLRPAMEIGLIYKPNNFLSFNTKKKNVNINKQQK